VGIAITMVILNGLVSLILGRALSYDLIRWIPGRVPEDVRILQIAVIIITLIEFCIFALPLSFLFLLVNKIVRATSYTQSIMVTGNKFGGFQILRRAIVPALLSVASGQLFYNLLTDVLFPNPDDTVVQSIGQPYFAFSALVGALIILPVALLFFMPTWLMNDSGIVSHLKPEQLEYRRCRDTIGVGRWFSDFLGGFSIIAIPISSFMQHFYKPFVQFGVVVNPINFFISLTWTIGLPLMAMAFIIPVIILNELLLKWTSKQVKNYARHLGAEDEYIQPEIKSDQHL
jgi:hypothetical protein